MCQANCKDCNERYPGCHDNCISYQEFKAKRKLENEKAREIKCNSVGWDGYHKIKDKYC